MSKRFSSVVKKSALTLLAALLPLTASAWPDRPIRLVVPYAPGGGTDILARLMIPKLNELLGQQVIVDNKAGGSSMIGTQYVAKAPADGYTILMVDSAFKVNPSLYDLPYNTQKDFAPVIHLASGPVILVANPALPANTVQELIALAKKEPGKLDYGSGGNGASTHLAGELFKIEAGVNIAHIPYKGTGQAMAAVIANNVPLTFTGISSARSPVEAGRLKAIAVTGDQRNPAMPNVPTFAQSGLPQLDASSQWGVLAPAGTPQSVIDRLNKAFNDTLKDPEIVGKVQALGYTTSGGTPKDYTNLVNAEIAKWKKVVDTANIKIQ
jgi:tripartite-type tricarboxylate transporter receptor subunit TctC